MKKQLISEEFRHRPTFQIVHYVTLEAKPIPFSHLEVLHDIAVEREENGDPLALELLHQIEMLMEHSKY